MVQCLEFDLIIPSTVMNGNVVLPVIAFGGFQQKLMVLPSSWSNEAAKNRQYYSVR